MAIKTRRQAFAEHCGQDMADVDYYLYHRGRTSTPVWAFDDYYYCITKGTQGPAKYEGRKWLNWKEVKDDYVNQFGWRIWKAGNDDEID